MLRSAPTRLRRDRALKEDDFRRLALDALAEALRERAARSRRELAELDEAAAGETKSSAGDKYETAREMIAQARGIQSKLLREAESGLDWLGLQDPARGRDSVAAGALFRTAAGWHLVCPVPGEFAVGTETVRSISLAGPLGAALKGARAGDAREFRGRPVEVLEVR